jgi:hypothetical protein
MTTVGDVRTKFAGDDAGYSPEPGWDWVAPIHEVSPRPEPESKTGQYLILATREESNNETRNVVLEFHPTAILVARLHIRQEKVVAYETLAEYDWMGRLMKQEQVPEVVPTQQDNVD